MVYHFQETTVARSRERMRERKDMFGEELLTIVKHKIAN